MPKITLEFKGNSRSTCAEDVLGLGMNQGYVAKEAICNKCGRVLKLGRCVVKRKDDLMVKITECYP